MPLVEELQQRVEDLGVGLLDLVQKHHGIGLPPHGLGQLPALAVADVSRRRADQAGDVVLFGVFAHVEADESALSVEEPLRHLLRKQRLADARRADEEEDADRAALLAQPGAGAADRAGDALDGLGLAHDAPGKVVAQRAQPGALALRDALGRDARHGRDDGADVRCGDLRRMLLALPPPRRAAFVEHRTQGAFAQPRRGRLLVDQRFDGLASGLPRLRQLLLEAAQLLRLAGRCEVRAGPRLVEYVDRLVGEVAVGDVACGELHAGAERVVRVADPVVRLVAGGDVAQDAQRLLGACRLDQHALEAALEGRVALDVGPVFGERRGADGLQLAACEDRLEDVGRVEAPLRGAGADDRVDFVDEENRLARAPQLVEQLLHALLELAPEFRPGDERRDVEREDPFVGDRAGHFAAGDAQGQPFDHGALAHAGLADQDRVVLPAAREDLHHAFDLRIAPHDRVDAPLAGQLREVRAEAVEQLLRGRRPGLPVVAGSRHADSQHGPELLLGGEPAQLARERVGRDAVHLEHAGRGGRAVAHDGQQRMGGRDAACRPLDRGAQFVGECPVEGVGRGALPVGGEDVALDAQAYLVELPVLEPGEEQLIGERPLFAEQFQREEVLEGVGDSLLRRVECRPGDDALERL